MIVVGRPVGKDDSEQRYNGCKKVESGMCSFGKNTQAVGHQADSELESGQEYRASTDVKATSLFLLKDAWYLIKKSKVLQ